MTQSATEQVKYVDGLREEISTAVITTALFYNSLTGAKPVLGQADEQSAQTRFWTGAVAAHR